MDESRYTSSLREHPQFLDSVRSFDCFCPIRTKADLWPTRTESRRCTALQYRIEPALSSSRPNCCLSPGQRGADCIEACGCCRLGRRTHLSRRSCIHLCVCHYQGYVECRHREPGECSCRRRILLQTQRFRVDMFEDGVNLSGRRRCQPPDAG